MKPKRILLLLFLLFLSYWGHTQGEDIELMKLDFYSQMAQKDARMEEDLIFSSEEDEADYWKDQFRFEKALKEKEYTAYRNYIHFKRKAYLEHQASCDIAANHGRGYLIQAAFYTSQGTSLGNLLGKN